ncbi:MAG: class I SAM-dependent methyltransferase [Vicinamibacterales bacterium]
MKVTEEEIRPRQIFDDYLALARRDAAAFFGEGPRTPIACPACAGMDAQPRFVKLGFTYVQCPGCRTLFVSPRPDARAFSRFYREGESVRFWTTDFYRKTEEARREKLIRPKARRLVDLVAGLRPDWAPAALIDVGAGYGIFAEEMRALRPDWRLMAIEPGPSLAEACRRRGLEVIEAFLEDLDSAALPPGPRLVTCFELLEHVHDPLAFCRALTRLAAGGLVVLTTLSGTGFDIQVLGEASKAVHPPHHVNFFNPDSITRLFTRAGLQPVSVETPGLLDVDIVARQLESVRDGFLRDLVGGADDAKAAFQSFLANNRLSSHMWAVGAGSL